MKLILLVSFVAAASAASFGSEHCTWGPAYWCDHPLKAKECGEGATKYCIENDWAQMTIADDSACADCEKFIEDVKDVLNNGEVENEVIMVIKEFCNKLGSKATTCKLIVDLYGKKLLEELVTELKPSVVCTLLELCKKPIPALGPELPMLIHVDADPCSDCKQIFSDLKDLLSNKSIQQFVFSEVIMLCEEVGAPADLCRMYVNEYGPQVFQYIIQLLNGNQICKELCTSLIRLDFSKKVSKLNNDPCTDCKQIFSDLDAILSNPSVQQYLQKEVTMLCHDLGLPDSICQDITEYFPVALNYLISLLDAKTMCQSLGVCPDSRPMNLMTLTGFRLGGSKVPPANGDVCKECKTIFSDLQDILNNQTVQKNLFATLTKVCEALGISPDSCSSAIMQYGSLILQILVPELDGNKICPQQNLCAAGNWYQMSRLVATAKKIVKSNGDSCAECKKIVSDLADILQNKTVQNVLYNKIIAVCVDLGGNKNTCDTDVHKFGPLILNALTGYLTPAACAAIKLCPSAATNRQQSPAPTAVKIPAIELVPARPVLDTVSDDADPIDCILCNAMMDGLAILYPKGASASELKSTMQMICNYIPDEKTKKECNAFVTKYADQLIAALQASHFEYSTACVTIKVCPSDAVSDNADPVDCILCNAMMDGLANFYPKGASASELKSTMQMICTYIPDEETKKACNAFVTTYADQLIAALQASHFEYSTACVTIKVCPSDSVSAEKPQDIAQCVMCQLVEDYLQSTLPPNFTKTQIESALDQVCDLLPSTYRDKCDAYLKQYRDQIVTLLLSSVSFQSVCDNLKICQSFDTVSALGDINDIIDCAFCFRIQRYLVQVIKPNVTKTQVDAALDAVCILIGRDVINCRRVVIKYRKDMTRYLLSGKPVDTMCKALKICSSLSADAVSDNADPVDCILCNAMMDGLANFYPKGASASELKSTMQMICTYIPDEETKKACNAFVMTYADKLIAALQASHFDYSTACVTIKVCPSAARPMLEKTNIGGVIECEVCRLVMEELKAIINKNATAGDIEKFFDHICSILPSFLKTECDDFVKKYSKEIIELLKTLTPDDICEALKLCSSLTAVNPVLNAAECDICKLVMEELEAVLKRNATEKDIENFFENICSILPSSLKEDCDDFVKKYTKEIIDLLKAIPPGEICQILKLCPSSTVGVQLSKKVSLGSSLGCQVCEYVMDLLKVTVKDITKDVIEILLDKVCSVLPSQYSKTCEDFVAEFTSLILELLTSFIPNICDLLRLCSSSNEPVMQLKSVGGVACSPCEMVVGQLDIILKEASTQTEIEDFLKNEVCSRLSGEAQTACLDVVNKYLPEILNLVTSITPEELCSLLGLCSSGEAIDVMLDTAVDSTAECMICELIVKEMRTGLSQNATEAEIQKFLGMVCSKIPLSAFAEECKEFVDNYTKLIIQYLLAEMDPDTICDFLKVCTPSDSVATVSKVGSDSLCMVCDVIFGIIEAKLENNKTLEEVTAFIEKVCTILPDTLGKQCKGFLDIYGPVLLKLIVDSELSPNDICKDLKLCSSGSLSQSRYVYKKGSDECAFCKDLITELEDLLEKNEDVVLDELAKVCDVLPQNDQQECKNMIEVYGSYLLNLLLQDYFTPDAVCKDLKMCTGSLVDLPPVDKCKLGPNFWCASMDNAKLCNTVEHCRRHAWN